MALKITKKIEKVLFGERDQKAAKRKAKVTEEILSHKMCAFRNHIWFVPCLHILFQSKSYFVAFQSVILLEIGFIYIGLLVVCIVYHRHCQVYTLYFSNEDFYNDIL